MLDDPFPSRKPPRSPSKPGLWAEGGQKPKFDFRAFARASLHLTREGIAPVLAGSARATAAFGVTVASGRYRVPEDRWGRTGRFLPSYGRVAGWVGGAAGVLEKAGATALPAPASPTPTPSVAPPSTTVAPGPTPVRPLRPRSKRSGGEAPPVTQAEIAISAPADIPPPAPDDDDPLQAIRAVLAPTAPAAEPIPPVVSATPDEPALLSLGLTRVTGTALGWGLTALALPYGAVRATLAHLNGADLRAIGKD